MPHHPTRTELAHHAQYTTRQLEDQALHPVLFIHENRSSVVVVHKSSCSKPLATVGNTPLLIEITAPGEDLTYVCLNTCLYLCAKVGFIINAQSDWPRLSVSTLAAWDTEFGQASRHENVGTVSILASHPNHLCQISQNQCLENF